MFVQRDQLKKAYFDSSVSEDYIKEVYIRNRKGSCTSPRSKCSVPREDLLEKARFSNQELARRDTSKLTRPLTLMLRNGWEWLRARPAK